MDCSPPGSSIYGLLQARILEWGAIPFSRGSSRPRDQTQVSCIAGRFFTTEPPGKPQINKSSHKQSHFWNLEKMKQVSFKCSETMNTVFIHRTNNKNISIQFYSVRRRKQRTRENWISSYLAWMHPFPLWPPFSSKMHTLVDPSHLDHGDGLSPADGVAADASMTS